jgi:metacaspase-1
MFRLILLISFVFNIACLQAQTKHALIIAIGNYKYWRQISSDNDVPYIKGALIKQGFSADNITIITDAKATKTGIENAFKGLISRVKDSDIVVIHISSHGEQIEDDKNHDEVDGLDETIVAWDAMYPINAENYSTAQAKYFRDDEFGEYINQLRSKLGKDGDVVVFIDACHSGSGTRGVHKVRGNAPPLVSKNFKVPANKNLNSTNVFLEGQPGKIDEKNLATYVIISGALAEENNTEGEYDDGTDGGSLSIAISKEFENLKPGTTYRSFFAGILSILNDIVPDQHPVIEGDGIDRVLFAGKFVEQKPYVEIEEINANKLILKGGLVMGLDSGAKVALYSSGTDDPSNSAPIATGIISSAESFRSTVILDKTPALLQPAGGWVFITEPVYKINPLVVQPGSVEKGNAALNFSQAEESAIKNILKTIPLVSLDGVPELLLVKGTINDSLKIAGNGSLFSAMNSSDEKKLREQIQRYSQYKFLQKLELTDPKCKLDVKLVPYINEKPDTTAIYKMMVNGIYECNVKDTLVIWAKNTGDNPVYLNILDFQPDGIINPIFPNTQTAPIIKPEELKIEAGQEIIFKKYKIGIGPPTGLEIFKIFVSNTQIDMEKIAKRDIKGRGNFDVLERLVDKSYDITTRGDISGGKANGSVYNLLFRIKPAVN